MKMSYYLAVFLMLLLSISCAASTLVETKFKACLLTQLHSNSEFIEENIFTSFSSLYPQVLESLEQNPRWLNSSRKPLLILTPFHESEIQATIQCSKELGLQLRVRSGGHDYEGLSYLSNAPFVMVDLINIRSIEINLSDETAWVQAGATLGELYYKISKASEVHGFPAGTCPSVGIGGHISGGGAGTMLRKHGLASDHVVDAYLIDANGRIHDRESMGEDVFWAIRGGSATSFGVILSWKIRLVRVPPIVTGFNIHRTLEEGASKLIHRWQHIAHELHEDLFIRVIAQNSGDKSKTFQATFNSLFLGGIQKLIPLMNESFPELGLQAKDCTEMSWIQSIMFIDGHNKEDPLELLLNRTTSYKSSFKAKSDFVQEPIPIAGLEGVWNKLLGEETLAMLIMEPYGGRMNEILESETPFPHRKGTLYIIQYLVKWEVNSIEASKRHLNWAKMVYRYMTPYVSKSPRAAYFNYKDLDLGKNKHDNTSYSEASVWGEKYFKGNFRKLAQIKTKFDPQNFFRNEQSIPLLNSHHN
ncbi:berberine bridge enzyme-like 23 [Cajanus cajan]|uniref:Reticuline oxidase-like protein n=1 Tax=Cajanus cajan TaxID=3821 RepID=A0A151R540_CAJCA|nr:berberine bridge enzyme-like 23 [Cajanus cajan]KYP37616.1 Reticuline oxidase-like protein [Cajanus cajan]